MTSILKRLTATIGRTFRKTFLGSNEEPADTAYGTYESEIPEEEEEEEEGEIHVEEGEEVVVEEEEEEREEADGESKTETDEEDQIRKSNCGTQLFSGSELHSVGTNQLVEKQGQYMTEEDYKNLFSVLHISTRDENNEHVEQYLGAGGHFTVVNKHFKSEVANLTNFNEETIWTITEEGMGYQKPEARPGPGGNRVHRLPEQNQQQNPQVNQIPLIPEDLHEEEVLVPAQEQLLGAAAAAADTRPTLVFRDNSSMYRGVFNNCTFIAPPANQDGQNDPRN